MTISKTLIAVAAAAALTVGGTVAYAQANSRITFARGNDNASVSGSITGRQYRDFLLGARGGQTMAVSLTGNAYFNILPPGSTGEAIYNSSINGNDATNIVVPRTGDMRIRVYQMGAAVQSRRPTRFTLSVTVMN